MFIFDTSLPDGTYSFKQHNEYLMAMRTPKINEEDQSHRYFVSKNWNGYKEVHWSEIKKILEA